MTTSGPGSSRMLGRFIRWIIGDLSMTCLMALLFGLICWTRVDSQTTNSSTSPGYAFDGGVLSFHVKTSGEIFPVLKSEPQFATPLSLLRFLNQDEVASELELSEDQRRDIEFCVKRIEDAIEQFHLDLAEKKGISGQRIAFLFAEPVRLGNAIAEEVLFSFQRERFLEIWRQREIVAIGLVASIRHGSLSKELRRDFLPESQVDLLLTRMGDELREARRDFRKEFEQEIQTVLTPQQRRLLESKKCLPAEMTLRPLCLELAQADDAYVAAVETWFAESTTNPHPFRSVLFKSIFQMGPDGWVRLTPPRSFVSNNTVLRSELIFYLNSESGRRNMALAGHQQGKFALMQEQTEVLLDLYREESQTWEGTPLEFRQKWFSTFAQLTQEHLLQIDLVLNDSQRAALSNIAVKNEVLSIGLANSLAMGSLGQLLELTDQQRQSVRMLRSEHVDKVKAKLCALEDSLNRQIVGLLSEADQEILKKLQGDVLDLKNGNVEFHCFLGLSPSAQSMVRILDRQSARAILRFESSGTAGDRVD